jgi:glycosyltransferase involved in cell wall biosynthesis
MNSLKAYADRNIIYAGFVEDISTYYKGADLFLNPVLSGGGVKTKIIEAIAYGTTVISTKTGAEGIVREVCGDKLQVVNDENWEMFIKIIVENNTPVLATPQEYYTYYYWENIVMNFQNNLADMASG